ncbi:MAG: glycogen synthase GlgA [Clostridiales bacterium]|nr:glycogen synthase GlgA [Clostridiales bacterium]
MKVLYATSEALPFMASGGLGDVAGSLPQALRKRLIGCRIVMPLYDGIKQELKDRMKFITHITVPVAWRRQYCGIFEARAGGVIYYLLDNQYYFKRENIYGHYDDAERFAFFSRAVLEIIPYIDFKPDIIHCNDWQTSLTPVYYSTTYANREGFEKIKTIFTIHNIQYQGVYGYEILDNVVGIFSHQASLLENNGAINFMKGGIECADLVTTVSPTYANEILDPWYSSGLDAILNQRRAKLRGILNGIDTQSYNPASDKDIFAPFSADDLSGKAKNKQKLQELFGLEPEPKMPLIGIVSRLVSHKGLDLITNSLDELMCTSPSQLVVLGSGDWKYENFFKETSARYPGRIGLRLGFVPDLARKIYAGSDMFLMPSKSEPCGLSQMVALRYGAIPIVRETGGLKDSISDSGDGEGNGFTFKNYDAADMMNAIRRALVGFADKEGWSQLTARAMNCDFSWGRSANEYIKMYKELLKK